MAPQGAIFLRTHTRHPEGPVRNAADGTRSYSAAIARSEATKQSTLSLCSGNGLLRGACHRGRIRATRWLAMTDFSTAKPLCKDDVSSPLIPAGGETGVHKALVFGQRRDGLPVLIVEL